MLILGPVLVIVLPYLIKVERIEEFDRSVESGHDEANVLDVSHLRNGVLGSLFRLKILLAGSGCIAATFLHTHFTHLLIAHSAYILKLVL